MNGSDPTIESPASAPQSSPGEMLRAARELREIGVEDLAQRLRLEPRKLRQLEQDQFDHVGPPAYVRGYLRSIAKELDVDDSALLAAYAQRAGGEPPPLADFNSRPPVQISSDSQIIRYTTVGIVVAMLALVVLWWRTNVGSEPPAAVNTPPPADTRLSPAPLPQGKIAEDEFELVLEHGARPGDGATITPPLAAVPAADSADVAEDTAPAVIPSPGDAISLSASADAWIEVRDAADARLYFGMLRAGSAIDLVGALPYRLVIGNAAAVRLDYRDESIDLEPHSNEGVARLTVGEAPAP